MYQTEYNCGTASHHPAGEGETTQHTPRCWGRTSYSDEMAHCYCKPAGEGEREAVDWKNRAEGLEADLRSAVLVAWRRGAENWCRWNYPQWVEWLERCRPAAPDAGGGEDLAGKLKAIRDKFLFPTPDKDHTDYAVMTRCIAALQPGGER